VLNIDADEFFWGVITEKALAVARRPQGLRASKLRQDFRRLAKARQLTEDVLAAYERTLWEQLAEKSWR
jgi:hypothetical protein